MSVLKLFYTLGKTISISILGVRLPASSRTIYSYFVDMDSGNFLPWDILVPTTQSLIEKGAVITIGETMGVGSADSQQNKTKDQEIVPTVDTIRYMFLGSLLLVNKNPMLLTGKCIAEGK